MLSIVNAKIARYFPALKADRKAAGALEYALLASLIAVAIITSVTNFGTQLNAAFVNLTGYATTVATAAPK